MVYFNHLIMDSLKILDSMHWSPDSSYWNRDSLSVDLDSGFQPLAGFRFPWVKFRISSPGFRSLIQANIFQNPNPVEEPNTTRK